MNVLSNAIDALIEAVETSVSHSKITIRTEVLDADWVRIRIADNGIGMTDAVKARLFDPFFTTKPVGAGTGLELLISYQIVADKHGGRLPCLSELGQSAEFWIEIPLRQVQTRMKISQGRHEVATPTAI